jgi:hypothetical protein
MGKKRLQLNRARRSVDAVNEEYRPLRPLGVKVPIEIVSAVALEIRSPTMDSAI